MKKRFSIALILIFVLIMGAVLTVSGQQEASPAVFVSQDDLQLTIYYQNNIVIVQDTRTFTLSEGLNYVDFSGVSPTLNPRSIMLSASAAGTQLLQREMKTPDANTNTFTEMLRRNIGENIQLVLTDETEFEGILLETEGQIILQLADNTLVTLSQSQIREYQLATMQTPSEFDAPTLRLLVSSAAAGDQQITITYVTQAIYGEANYNLMLTADESVELFGWLNFSNYSDATYPNADITLVAGDFNRLDFVSLETEFNMAATATAFATQPMPEAMGGGGGTFLPDQTFIYHVPQRLTLEKGETPALQYLAGAEVTAENVYIFDGSPRIYGYSGFITSPTYGISEVTAVQNFLSFAAQQDGEDLALLPGVLRVYQEENDGTLLLIGETPLTYTPAGETVQIYLENTEEVTGERRQTEFQQLSNDVIQESYEIRLRNRKAEAVTVTVPERMTRSSMWEILGSSMPFEQPDPFGIEFTVEVPAGGEVVFSYTVLYTRPPQ